MKTASFKTYAGPGRISIARWEPRGTPARYRRYPTLAPTREMMRMSEAQYRKIYFRDIVGHLDARVVWDELHELAGDAEPVLLCWEKPPFSAANWCHRRILAEWFADKLGVDIAELAATRPNNPTQGETR